MDAITSYRVTDLNLYSTEDLTALAAALEARGLYVGHRGLWLDDRERERITGPQWFWRFQAGGEEPCHEPEQEIAAMLLAVESLDAPLRSAWAACSLRVFDIAYDCGLEPFAFRQGLSAELLARLAAVGGTLRVTLYSDPETNPAERCATHDPAGM